MPKMKARKKRDPNLKPFAISATTTGTVNVTVHALDLHEYEYEDVLSITPVEPVTP